MRSAKERAYRYDLYIIPYWRESFDQMVIKHVDVPPEGSILAVNCGTGGLAIELATMIGPRGAVIGIDPQAERLTLARAKASVKELDNISFLDTTPAELGLEEYAFDLIIGDATLMPPDHIEALLAEIARLANDDALVALTMLTRGSFGEVFSLLWEALYHCQLTDSMPQVEKLINEAQTTSQAREMLQRQGLSHVRSFTERKELEFASAQEFFDSPLIEDYFLDHWSEFLTDAVVRQRVIDKMIEIIDRERRDSTFEVSVKASLLIGKR